MNSEIIGIIDLGSNSSRLAVYQIRDNGAYQPLYTIKRRLQLASHLDDDMRLDNEGLHKAVHSAQLFAKMGRFYGVTHWIPVATAAIRQSVNQSHILQKLHSATGLTFRVLSGEEEGRLGYLGVINTVAIEDGLLFDIGGASTELTLIKDRRLMRVVSLPYGALNLTSQFKSLPINSQGKFIYRFLQERLAEIPWLETLKAVSIVGMGGAARALGKLDRSQKNLNNERLHGYEVSVGRLHKMAAEICSSPLKDLTKMKGISKQRAEVIAASAAAIQAIADTANAQKIIISRSGLREGLLFQYMLRDQPDPVVESVLQHSLVNFQKLYNVNPAIAEIITDTALGLFDALLPLHRLGARERALLQVAAQIETCGLYINTEKSARHSAYLALSSHLHGLPHNDYQFIADLLCGGKHPAIQKLSMLMRLAKLAALSADIPLDNLICDVQDNHVLFGAASGLTTITADVDDADLKKDFAKVFGRPLVFA